jgi:putative transposase
VAFINDHKDRFGVEPICRVLTAHGVKIAPSTYYAARNRPSSPRAQRDAVVLEHVVRVHSDPKIGRGVYGSRKVWNELRREQQRGEHLELGAVPRCQVERLMAANGLRGVRRDKGFVTTTADKAAARPPDLVKRDFTATAPNVLWVVDFTYVSTWA